MFAGPAIYVCRPLQLACVNIVVATNAGGSLSPLGGISTLFVWQRKILPFYEFFSLAAPCMVNFIVPAAIMHFFVPKETPAASSSTIWLRRGSKRVITLFIVTLAITVWSNIVLQLPPAAGMMAGLGLLQLFSFYLTKKLKVILPMFTNFSGWRFLKTIKNKILMSSRILAMWIGIRCYFFTAR